MFIQIIQGSVTDPEALKRSIARWQSEIKPGATGYLGSTSGITPDALPRVFEPDFCRALIGLYEGGETAESGFMQTDPVTGDRLEPIEEVVVDVDEE